MDRFIGCVELELFKSIFIFKIFKFFFLIFKVVDFDTFKYLKISV